MIDWDEKLERIMLTQMIRDDPALLKELGESIKRIKESYDAQVRYFYRLKCARRERALDCLRQRILQRISIKRTGGV
ncbi:MAG TPA: hypothetical protein G4N93_06995 [Dehalococcoidia bacterium]|nr:hypothetical protein [Dehalococcoidia bacterium]